VGFFTTNLEPLALIILPIVGLACVVLYAREFGLTEALSAGRISMKRRMEIEGSEYGATLGYLMWGSKAIEVAYYLLLANCFASPPAERWKKVVGLVVLFGLSSIVPFVASQRLVLINTMIVTLLVVHYMYRRVNTSRLLYFTVAVLALLGTLAELRESSQYRTPIATEASEYVDALDDTLNRPYFLGVAKTSLVVASVPEQVDYLYGQSLTLFLLAPVPRTLWPEKPAVRIGPFVSKNIYRRESRSGVPPGIAAEFYMNFGLWGAVIGMFFLGLLVRMLYRSFIERAQVKPHAVVIFAILTLALTSTALATDLTGTISQVGLYLLPFLACLLYVSSRSRVSTLPGATSRTV